jgi:hypothetical protein
MSDLLDFREDEAPARGDVLRNKRIQMLVTFGRWERWWGPYPGVWEIEPVRQQRAKHEGQG